MTDTAKTAASAPAQPNEINPIAALATRPGTPLYHGGGRARPAQANASATAQCIGLAASASAAERNVRVRFVGPLTLSTAEWDAITGGEGGLTEDARYYISDTDPGMLTTTAPTLAASVGIALSSETMLVLPTIPVTSSNLPNPLVVADLVVHGNLTQDTGNVSMTAGDSIVIADGHGSKIDMSGTEPDGRMKITTAEDFDVSAAGDLTLDVGEIAQIGAVGSLSLFGASGSGGIDVDSGGNVTVQSQFNGVQINGSGGVALSDNHAPDPATLVLVSGTITATDGAGSSIAMPGNGDVSANMSGAFGVIANGAGGVSIHATTGAINLHGTTQANLISDGTAEVVASGGDAQLASDTGSARVIAGGGAAVVNVDSATPAVHITPFPSVP